MKLFNAPACDNPGLCPVSHHGIDLQAFDNSMNKTPFQQVDLYDL